MLCYIFLSLIVYFSTCMFSHFNINIHSRDYCLDMPLNFQHLFVHSFREGFLIGGFAFVVALLEMKLRLPCLLYMQAMAPVYGEFCG